MCAYTQADTRAKVGYRPYHQTDPFGAAHLSGYGSGLGRPQNPFDEENWVLHNAGLGAYEFNRPFDASGWELYTDTRAGLHGLGEEDDIRSMMALARQAASRGDTITAQALVKKATDASSLQGLGDLGDDSAAGVPAGSQLTYTAQISASFNPFSASAWSLTSAISALNSYLQSQWHIALLNWADNTPTASVGVGKWTVTLNLQNLSDYGALADIKSVADGAFYNAAGAKVESSSIAVTSLAVPNTAGPTSSIGTGTAAASISAGIPGAIPVGVAAWFDSNWGWVLGVGAAAIVLPAVLGGGRRR